MAHWIKWVIATHTAAAHCFSQQQLAHYHIKDPRCYGLAVAAAQYDIAELVKSLRSKGVDVKYAN